MRIWDIPCGLLCRQHLLGEHRELHALYALITTGRRGYLNHPERRRWEDNLPPLRARHAEQAAEIIRRGYKHNSPIPGPAYGLFPPSWEPVLKQVARLKRKGCACRV